MSTRVKNLTRCGCSAHDRLPWSDARRAISQLVDAASRIDPGFGQAVIWFLAVLLALLIVSPLVPYLRLTAPLVPSDRSPGPRTTGR